MGGEVCEWYRKGREGNKEKRERKEKEKKLVNNKGKGRTK
jgi:uncharacterized protein YeeX (DUF496 family)